MESLALEPLGFLVTVGACVSIGSLIVGAISHVRHQSSFVQDITAHGLWRQTYVYLIARLVTIVELVAAVAGAGVLVLSSTTTARRLTFLFIGLLYCVFCTYALLLLQRSPGAPCGCSAFEVPSSGWVPARAGGLAVLSLAVALLPGELLTLSNLEQEVVLATTAAICLGTVWWNLPSAMTTVTSPRVEVSA